MLSSSVEWNKFLWQEEATIDPYIKLFNCYVYLNGFIYKTPRLKNILPEYFRVKKLMNRVFIRALDYLSEESSFYCSTRLELVGGLLRYRADIDKSSVSRADKLYISLLKQKYDSLISQNQSNQSGKLIFISGQPRVGTSMFKVLGAQQGYLS